MHVVKTLIDRIELFSRLKESLVNITEGSGCLSGVLAAGLDINIFTDQLAEQDILVSSDPSKRFLEVSYPSGYYRSVDDLLAVPGRRINVPKTFYIEELNFLYFAGCDTTEAPEVIKNYLLVAELFNSLMEELADHVVDRGREKHLVFLGNKKILCKPDYKKEDLGKLSGLREFIDKFLLDPIHKEQKKSIVIGTLIELFEYRQEINLGEILATIYKIKSKCDDSYSLYVSEFSFDNVKCKFENEQLEFTIKLNKVFSDIQSQLLAIPIALLLATSQMVDSEGALLKNLMIWVGIVIFSVFMMLLIKNQRNTVDAITQEIKQQWAALEVKYGETSQRFSTMYDGLRKRSIHQKRLLTTVDVIVSLALAICTFLLAEFAN